MNQGKYIEKILVSLGLILIFSSSAIKSISEFRFLTDYLFLVGGLLILGVTLSSLIKKDIFMNNSFKLLTFIYGVFISLVIVSTFVNQNLETEIDALVKFILIYLFLGVCLTLTDLISKGLIIRSLIISSLIIFTYFLIEYPISEIQSTAYKGGFYNENSIGVLGATLFSVSLVAGMSLLKMKQQYLFALLYLLIAIGAGYLVLISNSRTSFVTLVLVFGIVTIVFIYDVLKTRNILSWKSIFITLLLAISGVSLFILIDNPAYALLESTVLDKFASRIESGRLTDGRIELWLPIIEGAGLFGKGDEYFSEMSNGLSAHNSFLRILSLYGWYAAIAYTIFWFVMLIKSVNYYLKEKLTNTYALLPFLVVINYILLSMMENMTFHVSAFLAVSMVAIFSKQSKQKKDPSIYSYMYNRYSRMDRLHSR